MVCVRIYKSILRGEHKRKYTSCVSIYHPKTQFEHSLLRQSFTLLDRAEMTWKHFCPEVTWQGWVITLHPKTLQTFIWYLICGHWQIGEVVFPLSHAPDAFDWRLHVPTLGWWCWKSVRYEVTNNINKWLHSLFCNFMSSVWKTIVVMNIYNHLLLQLLLTVDVHHFPLWMWSGVCRL